MKISVAQYKDAISQFSERRQQILLKMYMHGPFQDTLYLARVLGYPNVGAPNVQIGTMGRVICDYLSIEPTQTYSHNGIERPAYYTIIHNYGGEGWDLVVNLRKAIESLKWSQIAKLTDFHGLPTEESFQRDNYLEGRLLQVFVNKFERSVKARAACLRHHGNKCFGCNIDFKAVYGDDIPDIIQVHHVKALSEVRSETITNIASDLVPLCPNCHAVVHSQDTLMNITELKKRCQKKQ